MIKELSVQQATKKLIKEEIFNGFVKDKHSQEWVRADIIGFKITDSKIRYLTTEGLYNLCGVRADKGLPIAQIIKEAGISRQTYYNLNNNPVMRNMIAVWKVWGWEPIIVDWLDKPVDFQKYISNHYSISEKSGISLTTAKKLKDDWQSVKKSTLEKVLFSLNLRIILNKLKKNLDNA